VLNVSNLNVYYGESHTVHDVSFELGEHEAVAIMGRNGVGKTTLLKSIIGMLPSRSGEIVLDGKPLQQSPSYERVRQGLAFVPQGRMIFPTLTVKENILSGMTHVRHAEVPEYIYRYFPVLKEMQHRKGGNLSGGQQQMLAIARALVSNPKVLILDEPTEGIQPSIIKDLAKTLTAIREERAELARALTAMQQERHFSILVSEQVLSFALEVADRFLVLDRGRIVHSKNRHDIDLDEMRGFLTV
jgi:urea transport system ATP-binding protein